MLPRHRHSAKSLRQPSPLTSALRGQRGPLSVSVRGSGGARHARHAAVALRGGLLLLPLGHRRLALASRLLLLRLLLRLLCLLRLLRLLRLALSQSRPALSQLCRFGQAHSNGYREEGGTRPAAAMPCNQYTHSSTAFALYALFATALHTHPFRCNRPWRTVCRRRCTLACLHHLPQHHILEGDRVVQHALPGRHMLRRRLQHILHLRPCGLRLVLVICVLRRLICQHHVLQACQQLLPQHRLLRRRLRRLYACTALVCRAWVSCVAVYKGRSGSNMYAMSCWRESCLNQAACAS